MDMLLGKLNLLSHQLNETMGHAVNNDLHTPRVHVVDQPRSAVRDMRTRDVRIRLPLRGVNTAPIGHQGPAQPRMVHYPYRPRVTPPQLLNTDALVSTPTQRDSKVVPTTLVNNLTESVTESQLHQSDVEMSPAHVPLGLSCANTTLTSSPCNRLTLHPSNLEVMASPAELVIASPVTTTKAGDRSPEHSFITGEE